MTRTLIYSCVFFNEKYINLINLLLKSYRFYTNSLDNIDYLIICNSDFKKKIQEIFDNLHLKGKIWCLDLKTKFEAGFSRLKIFEYHDINLYNKILYLDCDILVTNSINNILDFKLKDKLYALKEDCHRIYHCELFTDEEYKLLDKNSAFSSGILLFNNNKVIKDLFSQILLHINNHLNNNLSVPVCLDQPFIIYYAIKNNLYNNQKLINICINNPKNFNNQTISHFPGGPGDYESKIVKMSNFINNMMFNLPIKQVIPKINLINKSQKRCIKNTIFPLIGICISYKYMDTLKFALPINYNHFDKLYLVTQKDDVETIEYCKKFNNVEVLLFNFKTEVSNFDKGGAIKMVQQIVYEKYPNHWYLILDSDIILPNNFIDILIKEDLNEECIYGAIRNNIVKTSKIGFFLNNKFNFDKHNNLETLDGLLLIGSFQLYKKKHFYIETDDNFYVLKYNNPIFKGADHDILFTENYKCKCCLNNIIYLHLGIGDQEKSNWLGKKYYFVDDCNINLNQIYFNCNVKCTNTYYDKNRKILNSIKNTKSKLLNIHDDVWTCSDEFREEIKDFFKDKPKYKIAEIGSHKGYTSRYLSDIFEKVYCVDNSVEWTNFNKNLNKDKNNIEYVHLDIYQDSWDIIPDVEVVFIDADHSYGGCKSDMYNSLKRFKNLKYIIFDDYGVWPGVKQCVNESLINNTLIFENYIGLNNIPGLNNKVVKNTSEGIICGINLQLFIIHKKYVWGDSYIEFLENGTMNAFGSGKYSFINKYLVKCDFGNREHLLRFNRNYSRFISIRKSDLMVIISHCI